MKRLQIWLPLCLLAGLAACTIPDHSRHAQELARQYYQHLKAGALDQAAALFPPDKRDMQLAILKERLQKLGALQDFQLSGEENSTVYSGKFYIFDADTRYEKTAASEVLTLLEKVNDDKLYVVSQKVDPDRE
ncbi:MAG TPA: hypothetical protein ENK48_02570 [Gammaproteobacteria bacterium]|nr:hypothetical protein [Gammaproteobacteria bacterium]